MRFKYESNFSEFPYWVRRGPYQEIDALFWGQVIEYLCELRRWS